jgi:anti-anti-sigma factor
MEGIQISLSKVGARRDVALFRVKGYLDTQTCTEMLREMTAVLKQGIFYIIVDMGQVNYVSSAGWGVFVGEIKGIRENGGDLKLVQMMPEVYDVFEMLEFHRILECYDSIEEAIDDFDLSIGLDVTKSVFQASPTRERGFAKSL